MPSSPNDSTPKAWIVLPCADAVPPRVFDLTPEERLQRTLTAAGCGQIGHCAAGDEIAAAGTGSVLLLRGDALFDPRVVASLVAARGTLLTAPWPAVGDRAVPVAAHVDAAHCAAALAWLRGEDTPGLPPDLARVLPGELTPAYIVSLRKACDPYVVPVQPETAASLERQLFRAAYKSVTDLVTKWAFPAPAEVVVRALARRGVHPTTITLGSWLGALAALWGFATGHFGLGLVAAWTMTFLDTVDGKLARVTLSSSRLGHVLDHGLDLVHPPFWYLAWGYGVTGTIDTATWIVVGGYLAGRLLEGGFILAFGIEIHCWRPIDTLFRTITARRNPNLILLSVATLGGAAELGMPMVAIWTLASIAFHSERLVRAFVARARGTAIEPWDESPAPPLRPISEPGFATTGPV
jgi:hypothetical protein